MNNLKKSFLINFHRLFVFFRSDIKRFENKEIVGILLQCSNNDFGFGGLAKEFHIDFLLGSCEEDVEIHVPEPIKKMLLYTFEKLKNLFNNMEYEEAYDVVDAIHGLPEMFAYQQTQHLDDFWKTYIEPIRRKWRSDYYEEFKELFAT